MTTAEPDPPAEAPWRVERGTVIVRFRLTPRGGKDAVDGLTKAADGPAFKARVRAVPEDGAANAALLELVARWLDVRVGDVTLVAGHKSRVKSVSVQADPALIEPVLAARLRAFSRVPRVDT